MKRVASVGTMFALWVLVVMVIVHVLLVVFVDKDLANMIAILAAVISRLDAPAWVQAVGSIGAIFVAIIVPAAQQYFSNRNNNRADVERRDRLIELSAIAINNLYNISQVIVKDLKDYADVGENPMLIPHRSMLFDSAAAVSEIPVWQVEDMKAAGLILHLQAVILTGKRAALDKPEKLDLVAEHFARNCNRYLISYPKHAIDIMS